MVPTSPPRVADAGQGLQQPPGFALHMGLAAVPRQPGQSHSYIPSSRQGSSASPWALLTLPPCAEPVSPAGGGRALGTASASDAGAQQGFCSTAVSCLCTNRLSLRLTSILMKQIPADRHRIHRLQSSPTSVSWDGLLLPSAACLENRSTQSRRPGGSSSRTR